MSHGENCPEPGLALNDLLISFGRLVELVSFCDDFYLALGDKVESFLEIFKAVLRAANHLNSFAD